MGLIDKEKLMQAMYHRAFETDDDTMWMSGCWVRYRAIEDVIKSQPEKPESERKRGHWIEDVAYYDEEGCPCIVTRCDQCGEPGTGRYCPNCDAEMREENDG